MCLADANLPVDAIDYINAHGTGTVANDITEIEVIKAVFGDEAKRLSISSTKSTHGHALDASGSLELVAVIEAIRRGIVSPTINIEELDPECDLDVTPGCAWARPGDSLSYGALPIATGAEPVRLDIPGGGPVARALSSVIRGQSLRCPGRRT